MKAQAIRVKQYGGPEVLELAEVDVGDPGPDEIRIKQVFNNLIGNALKFTEAEGVEVLLRARREDVHVHLEGEVADTGAGVPEDRLASIFQPFNQTKAGVRHGGAGLGLSIARQIAEAHGGTLRAANRIDPEGKVVGASFVLILPAIGA